VDKITIELVVSCPSPVLLQSLRSYTYMTPKMKSKIEQGSLSKYLFLFLNKDSVKFIINGNIIDLLIFALFIGVKVVREVLIFH